ncbi:MAG: MOSC domain-containing protein [Burkholderiaceae bacterium]
MQILTLSAGTTRLLMLPGESMRSTPSAIRKEPISTLQNPTPIALTSLGLVCDEQSDQTVHGGQDKALYAFPVEHWSLWRSPEWSEPQAGVFGENLLTQGLDETSVFVGDRWRIGEALLQVTEPRIPCDKFCAVMGSSQAARHMVQLGTCGWYLRVIEPAPLAAGMTIEVIPGSRDTSVAAAFAFKSKRVR